MSEKEKMAFCRRMGMTYVKPTAERGAETQKDNRCPRQGCGNVMLDPFKGYCCPKCFNNANTPRKARSSLERALK